MSIKLIATDLDGTLMSGDHLTVSPRTVAALQAAHDRGVCLAIATGRTLDFIDHVTAQVPFVDYVIYSNGAAVYDRKNDAHICQQLIPPKAVQRILQTLAPQPLYYNVYWDGGMYLEEAAYLITAVIVCPGRFWSSIWPRRTGWKIYWTKRTKVQRVWPFMI